MIERMVYSKIRKPSYLIFTYEGNRLFLTLFKNHKKSKSFMINQLVGGTIGIMLAKLAVNFDYKMNIESVGVDKFAGQDVAPMLFDNAVKNGDEIWFKISRRV